MGKLADKAAGAEREVLGPNPNRGLRRSSAPSCWSTGSEDGHLPLTAPATPLAKLFDGHGSRLRGNWEPICVGRKPLDGTLAENAARWGVAGFDVESGRVPTAGATDSEALETAGRTITGASMGRGRQLQPSNQDDARTMRRDAPVEEVPRTYVPSDRGRFPSTVLLEHPVDCHPDRCVPECPAAVLKEQGGDRGKSAGACGAGRPGLNEGGGRLGRADTGQDVGFGDSGSCARFYFQARPARRERSAGCEGLFWRRAPEHPDGWEMCGEKADNYAREKDGSPLGNPHGSIKSLELTRYLAKLLLQPGPDARILVPFSGSGSEDIGAMLAGWQHVVAIEQGEQWVEVNRRRAAFWKPLADLGARDAAIGELLGEFHEKLSPADDPRQGSLWL